MALTKAPREADVIAADIAATEQRIEQLTAVVERVKDAQRTIANRITDMEAAEAAGRDYLGLRGTDLDRRIRINQEAHDFLAAGPVMVDIARGSTSPQYVPNFDLGRASGLSGDAEAIIAGALVPDVTCQHCGHTDEVSAPERRKRWRAQFLAVNELDRAGDQLIALLEELLAREAGDGPPEEYIYIGAQVPAGAVKGHPAVGGGIRYFDLPTGERIMLKPGGRVTLTPWQALPFGNSIARADDAEDFETPQQARRRERSEARQRATVARRRDDFERSTRKTTQARPSSGSTLQIPG